MVLGLLWCNVGFANSPYIFFGLELGSKTMPKNFKLLYEVSEFNNTFPFYGYEFKPKNPNNLFEKYTFQTSAISKTIVSIHATGLAMYTKNDCIDKMFWLRDKVLELKKKKFSGTKYKFLGTISDFSSSIQIIDGSGEKTFVDFECYKLEYDFSYKPKLKVYSESLQNLGIKEFKKYKKDNVETKGFE